MSDAVTISRRFCGPPDSANGGYACGVTARALGVEPAEVTLRRPPPLDRALRVERRDEGAALLDGDEVVSEARPAPLSLDVPPPVALELADDVARAFDVAAYAATHPFPTCFTCGPSRPQHDGLALYPGPVPRREGVVAWPWAPDPSIPNVDGVVDAAIVWAALDCPSGLAWLLEQSSGPAVLGRMRAVVHRRPELGERLVVAGWRAAAQGRKLEAGSAVWSSDGEVIAANAATWIRLTSDQQQTFKTAT
jgi:hypothetical protein